MKNQDSLQFLLNYEQILIKAEQTRDPNRCMVAPRPDLKLKLNEEFRKIKDELGDSSLRSFLEAKTTIREGFNDNHVLPPDEFPLGSSDGASRGIGSKRKQLTGKVRVLVVLVEFTDQKFKKDKQDIYDLFFSEGVISTGSVREYYKEVSNGKVELEGEVLGIYTMPLSMKQYTNNGGGFDNDVPNARTMCFDAAQAVDKDVDFSKYDNDGNGFVDAFVVVHAGKGSEETGNNNDIWSHKWTFTKSYKTDTTKVYPYLTVPENSTIGVCAHELGHLLFGFPDLYDDNFTSDGLGYWCLMAYGSWNNEGKTPAHPCAWCKVQQDWVEMQNIDTNREGFVIDDVKESNTVYRMWKDGDSSKEYFLLENRMQSKFDKHLPGEGLLIYHVDDDIDGNRNERHYQVALEQADGKRQLETVDGKDDNLGDDADPFPGTNQNTSFDSESTPNSKAYGGQSTSVKVSNIKMVNGKIRADLQIRPETSDSSDAPVNTGKRGFI